MVFFKNLGNILTSLATLGIGIGAAMQAAGVPGGEAVMAGSTAYGFAMAKDGHRSGTTDPK